MVTEFEGHDRSTDADVDAAVAARLTGRPQRRDPSPPPHLYVLARGMQSLVRGTSDPPAGGVPTGRGSRALIRFGRCPSPIPIVSIPEIEPISVAGVQWKPLRRTLGIDAFGINAYSAPAAGDHVVEEHTEETLGHQEAYVVIVGHATFTLDGDEIDAPQGTVVFIRDPTVRRHAVAVDAGTTVLAIGGVPGAHTPSAWEWYFEAEKFRDSGDYAAALELLADAGERFPSHAGRSLLDGVLAGARRRQPTPRSRRCRPRSSSSRSSASGRRATPIWTRSAVCPAHRSSERDRVATCSTRGEPKVPSFRIARSAQQASRRGRPRYALPPRPTPASRGTRRTRRRDAAAPRAASAGR